MFMATLGYKSDKFITVALKAPVASDRRGSHNHDYHKVKADDKEFMEQHIRSYEPGKL